MRKIVIDRRAVGGDGIGRYTHGLISSARAWSEENGVELGFFPGNESLASIKILGKVWRYIGLPRFDWISGPASLIHFPSFVVPTTTKVPTFVTVHDLAFHFFPDTLEARNRSFLASEVPKSLERASRIIVPSQSVAGDLRALYPSCSAKLRVVYQGIEDDYFLADDITHALPFDGRPYLLFVGTREPRKNLEVLLRVMGELRYMKNYAGIGLAVVGAGGWENREIEGRLLSADNVRVFENISTTELRSLYSGAQALVLPSFYEGFGRPLVEAMATGIPVVASESKWAREVCGKSAIYFDPRSVVEAREAVTQVLDLGEDVRRRMRALGLERSRDFVWSNACQPLWHEYDQFLS